MIAAKNIPFARENFRHSLKYTYINQTFLQIALSIDLRSIDLGVTVLSPSSFLTEYKVRPTEFNIEIRKIYIRIFVNKNLILVLEII